jgi:hypothetical protein
MRYRTGTCCTFSYIYLSFIPLSSTCSFRFHHILLFFFLVDHFIHRPSLSSSLPPSHLPPSSSPSSTTHTHTRPSLSPSTHTNSWISNCPSDSILSTKQREREQTRSNAPSWYTGPCSGQWKGCSQVRTLRYVYHTSVYSVL